MRVGPFKEGYALNNGYFLIVQEKTVERPLACKEIKPDNPKENQPRIFIGRTDAEAEVQYFGHMMREAASLENNLMLGKIEGRKRRGQERMRWLDSITYSMDMNLSKPWEIVEDRGAWCFHQWGGEESDTA